MNRSLRLCARVLENWGEIEEGFQGSAVEAAVG